MSGTDDQVTIELDGHEVTVSNPSKVFFPERGETKLDLVEFYVAISEPLLAAVGGRPVLLQRFPNGVGASSFFQKRVERGSTDWLTTTQVTTPNGTTSDALVLRDLAHVAWAVNRACLGFHVWPYLAADPRHADELRIDLDPSPGVDFEMIARVAHLVHETLGELGIAAYPKTTGNRGIHIYALLQAQWDSYEVRAAAVALARELQRRHPDLVTAEWWKEDRGERVFVDFNQNAPHKTVFGAWSVRARPGAQVSTPFLWDELDASFHPDHFTMPVVRDRVATMGDPWAAMHSTPQSLEPLLEWHRRDMAEGLMDAPWPPVYPKQPNEPPRVSKSRARQPRSPS